MSNDKIAITYQDIDLLRAYEPRAWKHTRADVKAVVKSIDRHGFINPVIVDKETKEIISGHKRVEAARRKGMRLVPTIEIADLSDAKIRSYRLSDNKTAQQGRWDFQILGAEFKALTEIDLTFDPTDLGFSTAEIDLAWENADLNPTCALDNPPPLDNTGLAVSKMGDRWKLGPHVLLVADATDPASFRELLLEQPARLVISDFPYNVLMNGHASGLGRHKHREFAMASGEMTSEVFTKFLCAVIKSLVAHTVNGSIHYIFMDWRHAYELLAAALPAYRQFKNLCIWNKSNAGMGSFYRSKHELVFVFKNGSKPHINNFELGQNGRYRTNVWDYAGVNTFKLERQDELAMHPTVKPVALIADAIKDCSNRNDIVLDCFAGSGTTIIAAEQTGRRAYAMEIDPLYVDTAIRRWQAMTGEKAIHSTSGKTFDELALTAGGRP